MLEKIKKKIADVDTNTFSQHYLAYVMKIQDRCIDQEIASIQRLNSSLSSNQITMQINEIVKKVQQ